MAVGALVVLTSACGGGGEGSTPFGKDSGVENTGGVAGGSSFGGAGNGTGGSGAGGAGSGTGGSVAGGRGGSADGGLAGSGAGGASAEDGAGFTGGSGGIPQGTGGVPGSGGSGGTPPCANDASCGPGTLCRGGDCVPGCSVTHGCPGGQSCCGDTCIDASSDPAHCGDCTAVCSAQHVGSPACTGGVCSGQCEVGFEDCNLDLLTDGCETDTGSDAQHCGGCGQACSSAHIEPSCAAGQCAGTCATGFADCNQDLRSDGCEVTLATDERHCGSCDTFCVFANATAACVSGECALAGCAPGFADCDGQPANGCESDPATDPSSCGQCGKQCRTGLDCAEGECVAKICTGVIGLPNVPLVPTGVAPIGIATADLDADGRADLVVAENGDPTSTAGGTIGVFLGRGDGTFAPRIPLVVGSSPRGVAVGDLDGDGRPDIVAGNWSDSTVSVLTNLGGGRFAPKVDHPCTGLPDAVAVADLDGDGKNDVATIGYDAVGVLLNTGNGGLGANVDYATGWGGQAVLAGDLDEDGKPELVAMSTYSSDGFLVLHNLGNGAFDAGTPYSNNFFSAGISRPGMALGDVNHDRHLDLVTTATIGQGASANLVVFLNPGNGTIGPLAAYPLPAATDRSRGVALADFDGDQSVDVAVVSSGDIDSGVIVAHNQGDGTFVASSSVPAGLHLYGMVVADFNGDARPDIATTDYTNNPEQPPARGNAVDVLLNDGTGAFTPRDDYATNLGPYSAVAGDLDGDTMPDVVVVNAGGLGVDEGKTITVALNTGAGVLGAAKDYDTGSVPVSAALGDVDGDRDLDIVVAATSGRISVLLNDGKGSFAPRVDYPGIGYTRQIVLADLDGNGSPDVAGIDTGHTGVSVLFNDGHGAFVDLHTYAVGGQTPRSVFAAEFDGDDRIDLAVSSKDTTAPQGGRVSVLYNHGGGVFSTHVDLDTGEDPWWVTASDLNGDGRPDLAVANTNSSTVSVLLNRGNTFDPRTDYQTARFPIAVTSADLDRDGKPDLVVANYWGLTYLHNQGGTFAPRADYDGRANPMSIDVADMDGDGRPDLVTANNPDSTASVFFSRCLPGPH